MASNGGNILLAGDTAVLNGTVNVTGGVLLTARVDVGGTVNVPNGSALTLQGGSLVNPNRLSGGTINAATTFSVQAGRALHGFGTINAPISFTGTATLRADGGTLIVNGAVNAAGEIGASSTGILNVVNPWNSSGAASVVLHGGELNGATLTIGYPNGVSGRGLLSARVINNQRIVANSGTLTVQTAANDNDWDGAGNSGSLSAIGTGNLLELRDDALFGFTGTVSASSGGRVFTNGFALDFNPGSTLSLATGGKFESTNSTDIGGAISVGAGADATIEVQVNRFLTLEPTSASTLSGNLRLVSNNATIAAGATFAGTGALIVDSNSHLVTAPNANINVLLDNRGTLRPGGFDTVGRVDLRDYQQSSTGKLVAELVGTGLNQFDRLVVNGTALLDGTLEIDLDGGLVPTLGQFFNINESLQRTSAQHPKPVKYGLPLGRLAAPARASHNARSALLASPPPGPRQPIGSMINPVGIPPGWVIEANRPETPAHSITTT